MNKIAYLQGYMEKNSKMSLNKLRGILGGEAPLFHMVNESNAYNFIKNPKLITPLESAVTGKNLIKNVEGGAGLGRGDISSPSSVVRDATKVTDDGVLFNYPEALMKGREPLPYTETPQEALWFKKDVAKTMLPGVVGDYNRTTRSSGLVSKGHTGAKNWNTISFSRQAPRRAYGDVGMMTTQRGIKGDLHGLHAGHASAGREVQAVPSMVTPGVVRMPTAEGIVIYDPSKVSREMAKELKAQGAIPLSGRTRRLLKKYTKQVKRGPNIINVEEGNIPHSVFKKTEYPALIDDYIEKF